MSFYVKGDDTTALENFPLLVRISESQLPGFSYSRAVSSELAFVGADGVPLDYEVDTWNEGGESIVWVKIPEIPVGGTTVTMYWSLKAGKSAPANTPTAVWGDYAGVWHMGDANIADATGHAGNGILQGDAVARGDGAFGVAYGRTVTGAHGPIATVSANDEINALTGGVFTVSGWVRLNSLDTHWANIVSRSEQDSTDAWRIRFTGGGGYGTADTVTVHPNASSQGSFSTQNKFTVGEWCNFSAVYKETSVAFYLNGESLGEKTGLSAPKSVGFDFYIGGMATDIPSSTGHPGGTTSTLNGDMDEVRLYRGAIAEGRAKAEHANGAQAGYVNAMMPSGSFMVPSMVTTNSVVMVDYWAEKPSISKSFWIKGDGVELFKGTLRGGSAVRECKVVDLDTGDETAVADSADVAALPAGRYRLSVVCAESNAGESTFDFTIQGNLDEVYADHVTLTLNEVGTTPITNYTLLVRASETLLPGFSYARAGDGTKIAFSVGDGIALPYDVDTWNGAGESLIWVNVPVATNGTKVTFYWSLKDGGKAPANEPAKVWGDYAGVWHMGGQSAGRDSAGINPNATRRSNVEDVDGPCGGALYSKGSSHGPMLSFVPSETVDNLTNGSFTVSFWAKLDSDAHGGSSAQYLFARRPVYNAPDGGYALCLNNGGKTTTGSNNYLLYDNATASHYYGWNIPLVADRWQRHDIVMRPSNGANARFTWYVDGVEYYWTKNDYNYCNGSANLFAIGGRASTESGVDSSINGAMDEFRIRSGVVDTNVLAVESANETFTDYLSATNGAGGGFLVPGMVNRDGEDVDYWMVEPSFSPTHWEVGSSPTFAIGSGTLRSGASVAVRCVNVVTGWETNEVTQASLEALANGSYRVYFSSQGTVPIPEFGIDFTVVGASGFDSLGGTAEGRILLMNDDFKKSNDRTHPANTYMIEPRYQGWYYSDSVGNKKSTTPTFWSHVVNSPVVAPGKTQPYSLQDSTESILWTMGYTNKLWHLVDCRHGNTFNSANDTTALPQTQNFLPYSANTVRITSGTMAVRRRDVGQVVMRNALDAAVYSPCYTNGIGTIYFDAVNGWNDNINEFTGPGSDENPNSYQIVVEMATSTKDGLEPTDDNCATYVDEELESYYGNLDNCWTKCQMHPVLVNGSKLTPLDATESLSLAVEQGGSTTNFYRVYIQLDMTNSVRFRIRRASVDSNQINSGDLDVTSFLLLDNVIVSEPRLSASLKPAGWYDGTKRGRAVLGQECAFSTPFPSVGETVYARAVPEYNLNSRTFDETNFIASARMHYRWRYLDQRVGDWSTVVLDPENGFEAVDPIVLPDELGDVEFWYDAALQLPYYKYVDYSGANLESQFAEIYSEAVTTASNRADVAFGTYPTRGTDWFVRLREAPSTNEFWRIRVQTADGGDYDADGNGNGFADFELTDTGAWRAFVKTPAALEGGLKYRVEQVNPQAPGEDFAFSTNRWKGVDALSATLRSTKLAAAGAGEWSTTYCPGTTGYLMFVLDEGTTAPTLSVTSADWQNFNTWNDANRNKIVFVGTSVEDGDKTGVSPKMKTFDDGFGSWGWCLATNKYWTESFVETVGETGKYKGYTLFDSETTPNGWLAGHGMWVHEKYRETGMAYSMQGRGMGRLLFQNTAVSPRGIESLSFKTRLSQSLTEDDIYLSDVAPWNGSNKTLTNYTFVVQAAMSSNSTTSVSSWNSGFDGPGQISVFGGFRRGRGGYELRIMRIQEKRFEAALYRWVGGTATKLVSTAGSNNYGSLPFTVYNGQYPTMFMSVQYQTDGSCKVHAGFSFGNQSATSTSAGNTGHSAVGNLPTSGKIVKICYWDASPPAPGWGSFGVASANCDASFGSPRVYNSATAFPSWATSSVVAKGGAAKWGGQSKVSESSDFSASSVFGFTGTKTDLAGDVENDWTAENGNFTVAGSGSSWRICANAPSQVLRVEWAPASATDEENWQTLTNMTVSSFMLSDEVLIPVYSKENAAIRLRHGGSTADATCVDITVDDVIVRQWRGNDYDKPADDVGHPSSFKDVSYGSPTNFVFTTAWVHGTGSAELSAKRTATNGVASVRSPLMDGLEGRGLGLGMFSFAYTNADSNARLLLQIATNANVGVTTLAELTKLLPDDSRWTTVTNVDFSAMSEADREGGVVSWYLGLHGQKGVMRIVVDPDAVEASSSDDNLYDAEYGRVFITEVACRDEPVLDSGCWWGWNLRTGLDLRKQHDLAMASLVDYPDSGSAKAGMSGALNNSVSDDIDESDYESYRIHQPFIQTPVFTNGTEVGQVSIRARRYDQMAYLTPRVSVYGANPVSAKTDLNDDGAWTYVTHFDVTNDFYRTYTFKAKAGQSFEVLRFVVVGVEGVAGRHGKSSDPAYKGIDKAVRVALDDLVVTEALRPKLAFRNVFAFRGDGTTDLLDRKYVDRYGDMTAQPLAGESWGVQAEVYASQLPDEIDFSKGVKVTLYWYDDSSSGGFVPWGFSNWESAGTGVRAAELAPCDDRELSFRSTYADGYTASVIGDRPAGTVVQYMLRAEYYVFDSDTPMTEDLKAEEWTKPSWYKGIDYNGREFKSYNSFAAYCLLDSVSPGWAWINEVNVFGGFDDSLGNADETRQYIEVAMPAEADLTDWHVNFISEDGVTNNVCTFGADAAATKGANAASNCVFLVISSPSSKAELEKMTVDGKPVVVDGTWHIDEESYFTFWEDGTIQVLKPVAAELVRPSGVIEHRLVFGSTNMFEDISDAYSTAYLADKLNASDPDGGWIDVGYDLRTGDHSLGETSRAADPTTLWINSMKRTPGFINESQVLDSYHPTPNGSTYLVYATVDTGVGHLTQTFGNTNDTTELVMAVVPKGFATNITYNVENWYELDTVNVNGTDLPLTGPRTGTVVVTLGGPAASNNMNVVASARVDSSLSENWGLTPENRYTAAVVDWLNKGRTLRGPFEHPEGPLSAAEFHALSGAVVTNLSLTEMYWLDIDPTESNWWFVAGMIKPPVPVAVKPTYEDDGLSDGNVRMGVYLCLTNTASGASFAPYILRGAGEGSLSSDYIDRTVRDWDGPTFSIMGRLYNTALSTQWGEDYFDWLGQRWFVFGPGSFNPKGSAEEFQSSIEVIDPYSSGAPGFMYRWDEWKGKSNVYFRWSLGDEQSVWTVETLCPTNWLSE